MKKFIFAILIVGVSSLLGQNYLSPAVSAKKVKVKTPDEIEILVNDLLSKEHIPVRYDHIRKSVVKEGKYFVQMAAYSRLKPTKLISEVERKGYQTAINAVWRNDKKVNLLLVGPYDSRAEVKKHLSMLKSLEKDAFIYVSK